MAAPARLQFHRLALLGILASVFVSARPAHAQSTLLPLDSSGVGLLISYLAAEEGSAVGGSVGASYHAWAGISAGLVKQDQNTTLDAELHALPLRPHTSWPLLPFVTIGVSRYALSGGQTRHGSAVGTGLYARVPEHGPVVTVWRGGVARGHIDGQTMTLLSAALSVAVRISKRNIVAVAVGVTDPDNAPVSGALSVGLLDLLMSRGSHW